MSSILILIKILFKIPSLTLSKVNIGVPLNILIVAYHKIIFYITYLPYDKYGS